MGNRVLVVDDEQDFLDSLERALIISGHDDYHLESNPRKVAQLFQNGETWEVVLLDVSMPDMDGIELLEVIKWHSPHTECLMITAVNDVHVAVECIKKGAYDYLVKPIARNDLMRRINHALERRRLLDLLDLKSQKTVPDLTKGEAFQKMATHSPNMLRLLKEAELHAMSDVSVLITGESGTGKELLARAIHKASYRSDMPFTAVNMASLTESLFDAEFFGHTKGAFTGAEKDRVGYLQYTNGGTLFLDEIGDMPPGLQGKILRVLQEGEYMKLGTSQQQKVDIRVIAATNLDIDRAMHKGAFRKDLYYRLRGAWLHLPPLRERCDDIPLLVGRFLEELSPPQAGGGMKADTLEILMNYSFPGNVRELKSIVQACANLAQGKPISPELLPHFLRGRKSQIKTNSSQGTEGIYSLADLEKRHILEVYKQTGGNKRQTARLLGIGRNTLRNKLESYGVE
jgi:DNA-binding NtrC family response regulator